jgi:hypothetical protein
VQLFALAAVMSQRKVSAAMNLHTCIAAIASTSRRKRPFRDARPGRTFNDTTSKEIRMQRQLIIAALLAAATTAGFAQTAASTVQRDVNQEKRIEQGLQNGTITTREAALLQRDESRVDKLQAQALKDGKLSDAERAKLNAAQNKTSRDIATATDNGVNGNPLSASSQRAQADVQRNINQQQRVQRSENRQSKRIHHEKTDAQERKG